MKWLALLALCSCNQIFGVRVAKDLDADIAFFDRPIDAPFTCPPIGTAPQFTPMLAQILIAQSCSSYTTSLVTGRALAACTNPMSQQALVEEGPAGGDVTPAVGFPDPGLMLIQDVSLMPEGDTALVDTFTFSSSIYAGRIFTRDATGTWGETSTLPFGHLDSDILSNATRGPARHVLDNSQGSGISEWVEDAAGTWTSTASFSTADFGATYLANMRLSPDGLRLTFFGTITGEATSQINYVDRVDVTSSWSSPVHLSGIPEEEVLDAFMTEDCARVYFKALGSTFYAARI